MDNILKILFLLSIITMVSSCHIFNCADDEDEEFIYLYCGHPKLQRIILEGKVILEFISPNKLDSTFVPPKLLISKDSLVSKIIYPETAKIAGVQGIVYIQFMVDTLGYSRNITVLKGISTDCDEAVVRAIRSSRFHPAYSGKKTINIDMNAKIIFKFL